MDQKNMTSKFYSKEIPDSPVWIMGTPYKFDLLETKDAMLIAELDKCVHKGVGGVIALTEAEYSEELKKKQTEELLRNSSKPTHRQELSAPMFRPREQSVVANPTSRTSGMFAGRQRPDGGQAINQAQAQGQMPEPIQVPSLSTFRLPPLAKVSDVKAK